LEQPENPRKDGTTIAGELSGMEVDVPKPEYPAKARTEGVSGTVTVRVQVNKKGRVVLARSSGGDWRFRAAAVAAAKKATFSPETRRSGRSRIRNHYLQLRSANRISGRDRIPDADANEFAVCERIFARNRTI